MADVSEEHDAPRSRFPWLQVGLISLAHLLADGFIVFYQPLMPFLADKLGFTARASGLAVCAQSQRGDSRPRDGNQSRAILPEYRTARRSPDARYSRRPF